MIDFIIHFTLLIWAHFCGDFALQFNKMAMNKGSSLKWLTIHVSAYSLPVLIAALFIFGFSLTAVLYTVLNFGLHWATDFVTSKVSGHFNKQGNQRMFFATIGFDQAIHMTCLTLTYLLFMV